MSTPETPPAGASQQGAPVCYRHTGREAHIRCQRCDRPICPDCMRSAAVGFQCPSCVKEGHRSTRSGRTAYGGQRSGNAARTSQVLVALNVAVWLAILATGGSRSSLVDRLALLPAGADFLVRGGGQVHIDGAADGAPWQVLTADFTHVAAWHIGANMLVLWFLGPQLELAVGRLRFLGLYLLSGLGAGAAVLWLAPEHSQTLGASGSVFGLLGTLLVIAVKVRGDVRSIVTWIAANWVITILFAGYISWQGHLGGFLTGLAVGAVLVYAPRQGRTGWQAAGLALVTVVVLVLIAVRLAVLAG
jgi:membrane associated rhomboid family serine protease